MLFTSMLQHYILWHYTRGLKEIFHVWSNFFWFTFNFFSISPLTRSYFSPWKRITEERGNTFNLEDLAGFVIINIISRLIGVILRTIIIFSGLVCILALSIGLIVTYVFWLLAPAILLLCFYYGLVLIFS